MFTKGMFKIKKIGTSLGFLISKSIRNDLKINVGDMVGFKMWKINCKIIKCEKCNQEFEDYVNTNSYSCPHCGTENKNMKGGNEEKMSEEEEKNTPTETEKTEEETEEDEEEEDNE